MDNRQLLDAIICELRRKDEKRRQLEESYQARRCKPIEKDEGAT